MIPIIASDQSTGPFVRALIETKVAGTKLLAYDSYLTMGEVVEAWSRATGKAAELVVVSAGFMNRELGIPWEVRDAPGFIEEFGYVGGNDRFVHSPQLIGTVRAKSLADWEQVLNSGVVQVASS